jgi:repressor LexA
LELTPLARLPDERPTLLPLVGRIAAGRPIEAVATDDYVDLEDVFTSRHPVGVLTVTGDSMIDEHIREGDMVVYERRSNARNGDTVVALIDGQEATLKKFYKEKNRIRLQAANPKYAPLYPRDVDIQGVVMGVIRRF